METFLKFLSIAPFSHALWRSQEAQAFDGLNIEGKVLDIGCGFGEFGQVLFTNKELDELIGLDIPTRP